MSTDTSQTLPENNPNKKDKSKQAETPDGLNAQVDKLTQLEQKLLASNAEILKL